jgi:hypothetical protein
MTRATNVVHWAGEAGSPYSLSLVGWTKNAPQPGDPITVYMFQSETGNPVGPLNKIVLADGKELNDSVLGYLDKWCAEQHPDASGLGLFAGRCLLFEV